VIEEKHQEAAMKKPNPQITRRQFIQGTGALALGGVALAGTARAADAGKLNPFAYDLGQLDKTDPKLLGYEQVSAFACPITEPHRLALGPENRVYVAGKSGLCVLDRRGAHLADLALSGPARCVGVATDGTVYAGLRDHVEVYDRKGTRLATWDSPGKKVWFTGLAVGENDIFVADSGDRVVLRYDKSGKLLGRIGEKNAERNVPGLIVPSPYLDVALGHDGLLRVNNFGRHRVEVYTAGGDLEQTWGQPSNGIRGFCGCCNPTGLAMLPDGRYVTCEKGLPRVKVCSAEGKLDCVVAGTESFPENTKAHSMADCTVGGLDAEADEQGQVYVLDLITCGVRVMRRKA
jgi:hypothetical protein